MKSTHSAPVRVHPPVGVPVLDGLKSTHSAPAHREVRPWAGVLDGLKSTHSAPYQFGRGARDPVLDGLKSTHSAPRELEVVDKHAVLDGLKSTHSAPQGNCRSFQTFKTAKVTSRQIALVFEKKRIKRSLFPVRNCVFLKNAVSDERFSEVENSRLRKARTRGGDSVDARFGQFHCSAEGLERKPRLGVFLGG